MSYPQGPQGSYPQQGGYSQGYPPPQQGYPQQQYGGYPPPGYPPQPPKKNTALIVALAGVATAAVIALVLVLVLQPGDDNPASPGAASGEVKPGSGNLPDVTIPGPNASGRPSGSSRPSSGSTSGGAASAQALAEKAVTIIKSHSTTQIDALACNSTAARELKTELSRLPSGSDATLKDVKESGSSAQAFIDIAVNGQTQSITMEMEKSGSKWCAAGI